MAKIKVKKNTPIGYIREIMYKILPEKMYIAICYRWFSKKKMHFKNPQRLSEKWWWCMSYYKKYCPEIIQKIADKYEVIEYMNEKGKGNYVKELYGVYDDPNEIDFDKLPNRFALKLTKSNGYNIICQDKEKMDIADVKQALGRMQYRLDKERWQAHDLAWINAGKPRIICEEFLEKADGTEFPEIRFYCFNGEPKFSLVINDYLTFLGEDGRINHSFDRNFYDIDWNPIPVKANNQSNGYYIDKPAEYGEALALAKDLCKDFLFLRVDLYVGDGKVILGELTPAPAGLNVFEPDEYDYIFGKMLELPDVKVF